MNNAHTAWINVKAASQHVEAGNLGEAISALADSCTYFGQSLQDGSLEDLPYPLEDKILKTRLALLEKVGAMKEAV
jgi:hypothetical protein